MKKLSITIFATLISIAVSANTLVQKADSAYTQDNFNEAVKLYSQIIDEEGTSSELYYNLGNSYFRLGKLGKAIVCYERAIILDPQNEDATANLEFVNSQITDKPGDNGTWIYNTFYKFVISKHTNTWAIMALVVFLLLLSSISLYIFSSKVSLKKMGFFSGIIFIITTVSMIIFAYKSAQYSTTHNKAIVIEPSTILSTSPRIPKDRTEEAMLLHEGTKVEIIDSITDTGNTSGIKWYDVKVSNNHRAWIKSTDIEII